MTFYEFPTERWHHLRTPNPVESPFAALRLRADAAKRHRSVDRAMAVIRKMLMGAEHRSRRLKAPRLMMDVYPGAQYTDGLLVVSGTEGLPPGPAYTRFDVNSGPESHCPTRRDLSTLKCVIAHLRHRILE